MYADLIDTNDDNNVGGCPEWLLVGDILEDLPIVESQCQLEFQ